MKNPKIGAHISVAGGLFTSTKRAKEMGAECIQIFAGSPRRYDVFFPKEEEVEKYKKEVLQQKISSVFIHASYLINLASEDLEIIKKSLKCLKETLIFSEIIGAEGVVYHPGSPKGKDKKEAIKREVKNILEVLKETPQDSKIIIENTAGKKKIGTGPEEIGFIFKEVNSKRLRVCIDTAHAFESGNITSFSEEEIKEWLSSWNKEVGVENIALFHINDSITKANSQHDRHANIGEGEIGLDGFKNLMKQKNARQAPWILEVPGFDGKGPDKKNIDILKKIRNNF